MWEFWVRNSGRFRAAVFRPDAENPTRFTIVGINDITVSSDMINQKVSYKVPFDDTIPVERGDMIGLITLEGEINPKLVGDDDRRGENIVTRSVKVTDNLILAASYVITTEYDFTEYFTSLASHVQVLGKYKGQKKKKKKKKNMIGFAFRKHAKYDRAPSAD